MDSAEYIPLAPPPLKNRSFFSLIFESPQRLIIVDDVDFFSKRQIEFCIIEQI